MAADFQLAKQCVAGHCPNAGAAAHRGPYPPHDSARAESLTTDTRYLRLRNTDRLAQLQQELLTLRDKDQDHPRRQLELLLAAAAQAEGVLPKPKPFVLQTSLDDFYVSYQLNAYTREASRQAAIYSRIHQLIQDQFNAAGVGIMSPATATRWPFRPNTYPPATWRPALGSITGG